MSHHGLAGSLVERGLPQMMNKNQLAKKKEKPDRAVALSADSGTWL
jgi:hypothetical protein